MTTATTLMAAATDALIRGGYVEIDQSLRGDWPPSECRIFEDNFGVVAVVIFDTWGALEAKWTDAQASLVDLISHYIRTDEPKAWDGYLVLLTTGIAPNASSPASIRYNVSRVRKLVGTSDDLRSATDVVNLLMPLLPLEIGAELDAQQSVLDQLPSVLSKKGIDENAVKIIVRAFRENAPLVETLHERRRQS